MISKNTNEIKLLNYGFELNMAELCNRILSSIQTVNSIKDKMSESIEQMKSLNSDA